MKYIYIIWMVFCTISLNGQLILDDVLMQAKKNSIFYHEAMRDAAIAEASYGLYKSWLKPQVSLELNVPNYFKTSREIVQPNGSIQFQPVSQNNSFIGLSANQVITSTGGSLFASTNLQRFDDYALDQKLYNGIPLRIGLSQPLFQFNPWKWDKKIEPLKLEVAKKQYVVDIEGIHINTVDLYFNLLLAQENLQISEKNRDINERLLKIAEERFELGKISQNDRLQLSLEYKNAVRDLSRATYEVENAYAELMTFLHTGVSSEAPVITIPEPLEEKNIDPNLAVEEGRKNRPELLDYQRQLLEADRAIDKAKKDYGFQADIFASYGFARGSQDLEDIYRDPITEQQVQLSVSVPLMDWGRRKEATAIAQAQRDFVSKRIEQDQITLDNDIRQVTYLFNQIQKEVKAQKEIVEVTDQRFNISNERFILGDISTTDLTIAQREKDQAKRAYVGKLREYWLTYYQLRQLTGYDFYNNSNIQYNFNE